MKGLRVCDDVCAAAWLAPRLGGDFGALARTVPRGYAAYVRICHPAADRDGSPVSWSEVARSTGRQAHPLMQWHALVGSPDPVNMTGSLWRGSDPQRGNLEPEALAALCGVLGDHAAAPEDCFFCLWDGCLGIAQGRASAVYFYRVGSARGPVEPRQPAFSDEELSRPRVEAPRPAIRARRRSAAGGAPDRLAALAAVAESLLARRSCVVRGHRARLRLDLGRR
jgi:hypothetical protein